MNSIDSKIRQLGDLLRQLPPEARAKIFRFLAEKLIAGDRLSKERLESLLALYDVVAPRVDESVRSDIAQLALAGPHVPEELIERLATDSARVAAPILKRAPMREATLLNVIASTPHSHHLLIAERGDLTDRLREALTLVDRIREPATAASESGETVRHEKEPESIDEQLGFVPKPATKVDRTDWQLDDPEDAGFRWRTDRVGRLTKVSPAIESALGRAPEVLLGVYFFSLFDSGVTAQGGDRLGTLVAHRRPLRDIPVVVEDNRSRASDWKLRARSIFDRTSGRFAGYDGIAIPVDQQKLALAELDRTHRPSPAILERLEAETRDPLNDTISAACRLADRAKVRNDYDTLGDAAVILEDAHRLREMIEDAAGIAGARDELQQPQTFGLLQAIRDTLKDDAIKRGGISRFRIQSSAMDAPVRFDRDLFRRFLGRMLDAARRFGSEKSERAIAVAPGSVGFVEISVPIAGANIRLSEGDIFLPRARLEAIFGTDSPTIGPAFTPSVSLTVMRPFVEKLGGEASLRTEADSGYRLVLSLPIA